MATNDHGNQAKLLGLQAEVAGHVVKALKALGRAREEGVNVSGIFSQFFVDDVCKACMSAMAPAVQDNPSTSKNELKSDEPGNDIQEWKRVLPVLTEVYQKYQRKIRDGQSTSRSHLSTLCLELDCQKYEKSVCCFGNDSYSNVNVNYCACEDLNYVLVANGFFPASPSMAIIAIAAEVFDRAEGVSDNDAESVSRLLLDVYNGGGVPLPVDYKGDPLVEKFQNAFTSALPWYRQLKL